MGICNAFKHFDMMKAKLFTPPTFIWSFLIKGRGIIIDFEYNM
jgi:hypothetical protein